MILQHFGRFWTYFHHARAKTAVCDRASVQNSDITIPFDNPNFLKEIISIEVQILVFKPFCSLFMFSPKLDMIFSGRELAFTIATCHRDSVCLSSVTLVHPTQPVELFGKFFFHRTIAQGPYFSGAKNCWWETPLSP